ncbi:putative major facilitator superfamily transporter [Ilyonectria robusta]
MAYQHHELLAPTARRPTNQTDKVRTPEWTPTIHETLLMLMLSSVSFMVALDSCVIITALNAIITDLEITTVQGFWIGTSYLLSSAVTMPFIAEASEMFGRAIALMAALVSFTLGTLLCCLARSLLPLMMGRSLQGIGGAGIMSLSLIIFTDIVPLRYRPKWYGIV